MGTNFYTEREGRYDRHIGKSSAGWCFSFRVYRDIKNLQDWERYLDSKVLIKDEYGKEYSKEEFLESFVKRDRTYNGQPPKRHTHPFVVGWGEGHWDYIGIDFS